MTRSSSRYWLAAALIAFVVPLSLVHAEDPAPAAEAVSPRQVAGTLADTLESSFVYVDTGNAYAAMLRANIAADKYDALVGADLAKQLTADLQAVKADGHLHVRFGAAPGPGPQPGPKPQGEPGGPQPMMKRPPAMEEPLWIAPGIAFVRFNGFPRDEQVTQAAAKFVADYADAKAIIFDIRTHGGGGLDQMDAMFPALFAKPTKLVAMATRKSVEETRGSPVGDVGSLRKIDADPAFVTREHWVTPNADHKLSKAKIYVLTSTVTGSAAEHFSLAMKYSKRGILIGSHTAGANHFGGFDDLGGGFTAFIPVGRTYDPDTGKDWEGVGVMPDIDVPPEQALVKALELEGVDAATAQKLSDANAPKLPLVRPPRP